MYLKVGNIDIFQIYWIGRKEQNTKNIASWFTEFLYFWNQKISFRWPYSVYCPHSKFDDLWFSSVLLVILVKSQHQSNLSTFLSPNSRPFPRKLGSIHPTKTSTFELSENSFSPKTGWIRSVGTYLPDLRINVLDVILAIIHFSCFMDLV